MKKRIITVIVALCAVVALATVLCACSAEQKFDDHLKNLEKSVGAAAETITETVIKDGDTVVYTKTVAVKKEGENSSVTTTENKLGSSFGMEESKTSTTVPTATIVAPIKITADSLATYALTGEGFDCVVPAGNTAAVFGTEFNADVEVKVIFAGKNASKIICELETATAKSVTVTITFAY